MLENVVLFIRSSVEVSMSFIIMLRLICTALVISFSLGYPMFKSRIPNGKNVKNPFYTERNGQEKIWRGVGHFRLEGGGPRNPFGLAFAAAGYVSRCSRVGLHCNGVDFFLLFYHLSKFWTFYIHPTANQ